MLLGAVLLPTHTCSPLGTPPAGWPPWAWHISAGSWPEGTRGPSDGTGDAEGTPKVRSSRRTAAPSPSVTLREAERERGYLGVKCWGTGPLGVQPPVQSTRSGPVSPGTRKDPPSSHWPSPPQESRLPGAILCPLNLLGGPRPTRVHPTSQGPGISQKKVQDT